MANNNIAIDKHSTEITLEDLRNFSFKNTGMFDPLLRAGMSFAIGKSADAGSNFRTKCYKISNLERLITFESEGPSFEDFGIGVLIYDNGDTCFTKGLFTGWGFTSAFGSLSTIDFTADMAWLAANFVNETSKYWLPGRVIDEAKKLEREREIKHEF